MKCGVSHWFGWVNVLVNTDDLGWWIYYIYFEINNFLQNKKMILKTYK